MAIAFEAAFESLTGRRPFAWQARLFNEIATGKHYDTCDIPTGLGKTSIIPIWLIALAMQAEQTAIETGVRLGRRLVYVVDRRTVVDQATDDAETIRRNLREATPGSVAHAVAAALRTLCVDPDDEASPLAISTLRGEFADNREWQADPARAAIIVGTVDMIGSRLLFSGYGAGRSSRRALSAGLLGHDALLIHDEAHLSQPFGRLVKKIARIQEKTKEPRPLRVLEMSATPGDGDGEHFKLKPEERSEATIRQRIFASKALKLADAQADTLAERLTQAALAHADSGARVLVYVRTPELAMEIWHALCTEFDKKEPQSGSSRVAVLTGTLRGFERDELARGELFAAFKANPKREKLERSLYLVATSAGEVGVDLDADHMVCDLSTLDSMIQRLGRVNRLGREDDTFVALVDAYNVPFVKAKDEDAVYISKLEEARRHTAALLADRPLGEDDRSDVSPQALRTFVESLPKEKRAAAFAPVPQTVPLTDILLDNWALTSVRDLPGRPAVHDWLHGRQSEPPETTIAWREEADELAALLEDDAAAAEQIEDWFDAHRIEAQEKVSGPSYKVTSYFRALARKHEKSELSSRALLITPKGLLRSVSLEELADYRYIANATVVLPAEAGGLAEGMLDSATISKVEDVADEPKQRARKTGEKDKASPGLHDVRRWRVRISRTEDESWNLELLGSVPAEFKERVAQVNPNADTADRVVRALLMAVNKSHRANPFVERERIIVRRDEETGAVAGMLVSFGSSKRAETALAASASAPRDQALVDHLSDARQKAVQIAAKLGLEPELAECLIYAAEHHDTGKDRDQWQASIYNRKPRRDPEKLKTWRCLAKTAHGLTDHSACPGYRHELGSLIDTIKKFEGDGGSSFSNAARDLILHLIASHHGRARPGFESKEQVDPGDNTSDFDVEEACAETLRRYARMQRRFGRWGLAWLEALMKAADVMATTSIASDDETTVSPDAATAELTKQETSA
jgi:CRISPR-associated endonuclease/helicase Cas3